MNKLVFKNPITHILIEALCLVIIGILVLLVYGYKLEINRMVTLCFTFGVSAIILFNVFKYNGFKAFLIVLIVLTILITLLLFKSPTFLSLIHHAAGVVGLGVIIYLLKIVFPKNNTGKNLLWGFLLWVLALAIFILIVFILNGFLLKIRYDVGHDFNKSIIRALKCGPALGIGIGLGHIIASKILKE